MLNFIGLGSGLWPGKRLGATHFQQLAISGNCIAWIGMVKIGRRLTMVGSLVVAALALLASGIVDAIGKSNETFSLVSCGD